MHGTQNHTCIHSVPTHYVSSTHYTQVGGRIYVKVMHFCWTAHLGPTGAEKSSGFSWAVGGAGRATTTFLVCFTCCCCFSLLTRYEFFLTSRWSWVSVEIFPMEWRSCYWKLLNWWNYLEKTNYYRNNNQFADSYRKA